MERSAPAYPCGSRRSVRLTSSPPACAGLACDVQRACVLPACVQQACAGRACAVPRACALRACVQQACAGPACAVPRACALRACAVLQASALPRACAQRACAVLRACGRACAVLPASVPRACGGLPASGVLQACVPPAYAPPASGERSNEYARSTFSSLVPCASSFERGKTFRGNAASMRVASAVIPRNCCASSYYGMSTTMPLACDSDANCAM